MHLCEYLTSRLNRPLTPAELEMFRNISAQGVAKINAEICKGVNLEQTVTDLLDVFQSLHERRTQLTNELNHTQQMILSRMSRLPTLDELQLVIDTHAPVLIRKLNEQLAEELPLEDILEGLATEHRHSQLLADAKNLAIQHQKCVSVVRLTPTVRPQNTALVSTIFRCQADRIFVGMSPMVTWFEGVPQFSDDHEANVYSIHLDEPKASQISISIDFLNPIVLSQMNPELHGEEEDCDETVRSSVGYSSSSSGLVSSCSTRSVLLSTSRRSVTTRRVSFLTDDQTEHSSKMVNTEKAKESKTTADSVDSNSLSGGRPTQRKFRQMAARMASILATLFRKKN